MKNMIIPSELSMQVQVYLHSKQTNAFTGRFKITLDWLRFEGRFKKERVVSLKSFFSCTNLLQLNCKWMCSLPYGCQRQFKNLIMADIASWRQSAKPDAAWSITSLITSSSPGIFNKEGFCISAIYNNNPSARLLSTRSLQCCWVTKDLLALDKETDISLEFAS